MHYDNTQHAQPSNVKQQIVAVIGNTGASAPVVLDSLCYVLATYAKHNKVTLSNLIKISAVALKYYYNNS